MSMAILLWSVQSLRTRCSTVRAATNMSSRGKKGSPPGGISTGFSKKLPGNSSGGLPVACPADFRLSTFDVRRSSVLQLLRVHVGQGHGLLRPAAGAPHQGGALGLAGLVRAAEDPAGGPEATEDQQEAELDAQHVETFKRKFDDRLHEDHWTLGFVQNREDREVKLVDRPQGERGRILRRA